MVSVDNASICWGGGVTGIALYMMMMMMIIFTVCTQKRHQLCRLSMLKALSHY